MYGMGGNQEVLSVVSESDNHIHSYQEWLLVLKDIIAETSGIAFLNSSIVEDG